MNLKQETWELIMEGLEQRIESLTEEVNTQKGLYDNQHEIASQLRTDLVVKCEKITELKRTLNQYEKRDKIEHFINKMGRRYVDPSVNLSWERFFYVLYPSADEKEYHTKGKAKKMIIDLLRSEALGFDDNGVIFKI